MSKINRIDECFQFNQNKNKPPAPDAPAEQNPLLRFSEGSFFVNHNGAIYSQLNHPFGANKNKQDEEVKQNPGFDEAVLLKEKERNQKACRKLNNLENNFKNLILQDNAENEPVMRESVETRASITAKESLSQNHDFEAKMEQEDVLNILSDESSEGEESNSTSVVKGRNHIEFKDIQKTKSEIYKPKNDGELKALERENSMDPSKDLLKEKADKNNSIKRNPILPNPAQTQALEEKKIGEDTTIQAIAIGEYNAEEVKKAEFVDPKNEKKLDLNSSPFILVNQDQENEKVQLEARKLKVPLPIAPNPSEFEALADSNLILKQKSSNKAVESRLVNEYLDLCRIAKEDPVEYYKKNYMKKSEVNAERKSNEKEEAECNNESSNAFHLATQLLKQFPFEKLELTSNGFVEREDKQNNEAANIPSGVNSNPWSDTSRPLPKFPSKNALVEKKPITETKTIKPVEEVKDYARDHKRLAVNNSNFARPAPPGPPSSIEEKLKKFPFEELRITGRGFFDRKCRVTHEFVDLCRKANQNPLQYYYENYTKPQKQRLAEYNAKWEAEKMKEPVIQGKNSDLERLERFPLGQLKLTLKGFFNLRFSLAHEYLDLCAKLKKDPLTYYHENYTQKQKKETSNIVKNDEFGVALEKLKGFPFEKLRITSKGFFDMRFNVTQEYLNLCDWANKDPLKYYHENYIQMQKEESENKARSDIEKVKESVIDDEKSLFVLDLESLALSNFPLEELAITLKGAFDKRYKLTHKYLDLCKAAEKDPLEYYNETLKQKKQQEAKEKCCEIGLCDSCNAKGDGLDKILEELKRFPLKDLTITTKGSFDKRFKITKDYMNLCTRAGKDPLNYYYENFTR